MNPETIALQDEGLRENSEQTLQTFTPEKAAKKRLRVKGRSENAQAKRYGGHTHPRLSSQYCR
jgi:hypothetical protein